MKKFFFVCETVLSDFSQGCLSEFFRTTIRKGTGGDFYVRYLREGELVGLL